MKLQNHLRDEILRTCHKFTKHVSSNTRRQIPRDYDITLNLQYFNETIINKYIDFWVAVLTHIGSDKKIINLGSGSGIIERIGRENGYNILSSDFDEEGLDILNAFPFYRKTLGVPLDIVNNKIDEDGFVINTSEKFDAMLITRFSLFKEKSKRQITPTQITRFFEEFDRVADRIYYCEFGQNTMRKDLADYAGTRYNVNDVQITSANGDLINVKEISKL